MSKKTAVYICTGCGIGETIDVAPLCKAAIKRKAALCKNHPFLCGPEGVEMIKADIAAEGLNAVVIAACSPRVNNDAFDLGNLIIERVNYREQLAWVQKPDDEDTQMMAEDYLRMALVKVAKTELPEPYAGPDGAETKFSRDILVVGGGVSGMSAALEASKAGYGVTIVEKNGELGGWSAKWKQSTPTKPPYQELEDTGMVDLIAAVKANDKIKVYTNAELSKINGGPGLFDAEFKADGAAQTARFGAIIQATGWHPYDPDKLTHLGFGASPDIVTSIKLEEMAMAGKIKRPSDGSTPNAVAFIQCAGSRDQNHLPYCSAVCCRASLKQALYLKQQNPEMAVYIFYKDIRSPGQDEELYRQAQKSGVIFIRVPDQVENVSMDGDKIVVEATDVLLGDKVQVGDLDILVLATGMVPNTAHWLVTDTPPADQDKKQCDEAAAAQPKVQNSILNLTYRQGPDLPNLKYEFPDSHFICFPYETRRTAIYAAGCVRRPMTIGSAKEDAAGAVLKSIQVMESVIRGQAVHPRSGDLSYPNIDLSRCTQCRRCTDECPFGALNEDEKSNPLAQPTRCRRCGTCMGACPERLISFKNYSVDMIGSMIKEVEIPESDEEKPRVLILVCENDAYPALDMAGIKKMGYSPFIRT
ncbi:MAG: FAD-dependent oxidoreductase, partial [Deltaproteobacteria bacterium]|nr:FAD-dependent oxidoreductase [Deltaproteobacteria bacterium]